MFINQNALEKALNETFEHQKNQNPPKLNK